MVDKDKDISLSYPFTSLGRTVDPKLFLSSIQENHTVVEEISTINFVNIKAGEGTTVLGLSKKSKEWPNQF